MLSASFSNNYQHGCFATKSDFKFFRLSLVIAICVSLVEFTTRMMLRLVILLALSVDYYFFFFSYQHQIPTQSSWGVFILPKIFT